MTPRRLPRLAIALLERSLVDDEPLKGDLIEEFNRGRSRWWLWRQVVAAVLARRPPWRTSMPDVARALVAAALLLLIAFEAVFVANVVYRLAFGPPMQDITGYAYLFHRVARDAPPSTIPPLLVAETVVRAAIALPLGWLVGRLHRSRDRVSAWIFAVSIVLWAVLNLPWPFAVQFVSMLALVLGMLAGARFAWIASES
jgi:hypothetical protein